MKIKEIKCPNCNANISFKPNTKKSVCEYCKSELIIDDGNIQIEHTGTIELTSDTSLKIASTTLNKFKDYEKSYILYKRLLYKYAHKEEVYIGLIRSITKDFSIKDISKYELIEVNNYWKRYIALTNEKDISKEQESMNLLNKNYWQNELVESTNNFNPQKYGKPIKLLETYYNNYLNYCEKKDNVITFKYQEYLSEYKKFLNERKRKLNNIIKIIVFIIVGLLLSITIFLLTENTKKNVEIIKLSEINEHSYQIKNDEQYFLKYFKNTFSDLKVTNIKLNNEDKSVDITISIENILTKRNKVFNFKVLDDTGPIITTKECSFTDTDNVDIYKCFSIYDFTDGEIDSKNAIINQEGVNFKTAGTKTINVKIKDNDGNENNLDIPIIITKTPIELEFNIEENLIVGNTYNISYKITPNNIQDTSITYTYNKDLLSINNGKVKALKKGTTEICAISNYNQEVKQCRTINLNLQCKNTYTFNFDGSKEETIIAGEHFCSGTYKIYAEVMNRNEFYHLKVKPKNSHSWDSLTIYKNSSFLNEEGNKYNLTDGYQIITEMGIKSVKLIKTK